MTKVDAIKIISDGDGFFTLTIYKGEEVHDELKVDKDMLRRLRSGLEAIVSGRQYSFTARSEHAPFNRGAVEVYNPSRYIRD